jgi:hypothetical protein
MLLCKEVVAAAPSTTRKARHNRRDYGGPQAAEAFGRRNFTDSLRATDWCIIGTTSIGVFYWMSDSETAIQQQFFREFNPLYPDRLHYRQMFTTRPIKET